MLSNEEIDRRVKHHPPTSDATIQRHQSIREGVGMMMRVIDNECPDSREKSLAQTKLEESMFWANASIARNNG